jgi:spore germination cell wall hydrolase CwlJ-like protein
MASIAADKVRTFPALAVILSILTACARADTPRPATPSPAGAVDRLWQGGSGSQQRLEESMDPAMLALARRLDAGAHADFGGRTPGWAALDIETSPNLGLGPLTAEEAQRINAYLPTLGARISPSAPFILDASNAERQRALLCLTQAIYYEAALEPASGQAAVAQTILNRVRHPAFPKSICGVVYEGAQQVTGCQFSFACDGSRDRPPVQPFWDRAKSVAERALDGFVMTEVGTATAYHADYVFPRWGPTLVKIGQIGTHIFYRFPGPSGQGSSFHERYRGGELMVSMEGPSAEAIAAAKASGSVPGGEQETYTLIDPNAPGGVRTRAAGQVVFGRRSPTRDEIDRINAALAGMDTSPSHPVAAAEPAPAFSDKLPVGKP